MVDQASRGGKKQGAERQADGKRHQGVRKGSTARKKERTQKGPRQPAIPSKDEMPSNEGAASLSTDGRTWLLVAGGNEARMLAANPVGWTTVRDYTHPESRLTGNELDAISPGRQKSPGSGHRLNIEKTNPHDYEKERFARELADDLAVALSRNQFDRVVLAAAPKFLGELKSHLDEQVADRVLATIDKDFTDVPVRDLWTRITDELSGSEQATSPPDVGEPASVLPNVMRPPRSDGELAIRVHEVLSHQPQIEADRIEVTVEGCEVTLHGTVSTPEARDLAELTAKSVPKVAGVRNHLTVES